MTVFIADACAMMPVLSPRWRLASSSSCSHSPWHLAVSSLRYAAMAALIFFAALLARNLVAVATQAWVSDHVHDSARQQAAGSRQRARLVCGTHRSTLVWWLSSSSDDLAVPEVRPLG